MYVRMNEYKCACVCMFIYVDFPTACQPVDQSWQHNIFTPVGSPVGISLSFSPLFTSISLHNFFASGRAVLFWVIDIENIERGK